MAASLNAIIRKHEIAITLDDFRLKREQQAQFMKECPAHRQ